MHKHAINDTVHEVLKKLDKIEEERLIEQVQRIHITRAPVNDIEHVQTGRPPIQEMAGGWAANQRDKARVQDAPLTQPGSVCYGDVSRPSTGYKEKRSSVCPIGSSPPSPSTGRSPQGKTQAKPSQQDFRKNLFPQYHRQFSSPDTFNCHPAPARGVHITYSNVTGLQQGDHNTMCIHVLDPRDRKRHPTAPSSINLPPPNPGS